MRFGFEDDRNFEEILTILDKHQIDLEYTCKNVKGGYRMKPEYSYVKKLQGHSVSSIIEWKCRKF